MTLSFRAMAEREGFEPSIELPLYTLSKRAPSTTRPSLRLGCARLFPQDNTQPQAASAPPAKPIPLAPEATMVIVSARSSRRAFLASSAALLACGRRKATRYPGYCFVANHDARSIALVDLSSFRRLRAIRLDAAPSVLL